MFGKTGSHSRLVRSAFLPPTSYWRGSFLSILHCVVALILYSQPHWAFLKDLLWDLETKALLEVLYGLWVRSKKESNQGRHLNFCLKHLVK